jgi:hypothetical protein
MTAPKSKRWYLGIEAEGDELAVFCFEGRGAIDRRTVNRDTLLNKIAEALREKKSEGRDLAGIALVGAAKRFSESRSLATVANTLSYALGVPVGKLSRRAGVFLGVSWPIEPKYCGEPNITLPRSEKPRRKK